MRRHHVLRRLLPLATLAAAACAPAQSPAPAPARSPAPERVAVLPGADRLADSIPSVLRGKRVGLVTNHTGRDRNGRSLVDILAARTDLELVILFGPEHGIRGDVDAGGAVPSGRDPATGLPVQSLYGEVRQPTPEMLRGVEALIFDIQDVGARPYTYVSTMALAMEAAARDGIPFVVLDRPNPIGGMIVEGARLDTAYASFVGMYPIPERHGLTIGELARLFNAEYGIGAELVVVPVSGWTRDQWLDETGLPWVTPSPNLRRLEAAIHYPGTVFFEGTNLSEGRGTDMPFEQVGAPWLRADTVASAMNAMQLPGVRFEAVTIPIAGDANKFKGDTVPGVRLVLTDREAYRPVSASLWLIHTIRRLHPNDFEFRGELAANPGILWIDRLTGSDRARKAIVDGTLPALLAAWDANAAEFKRLRAPYLLY